MTIAVIVLACLIGINVWATRRVMAVPTSAAVPKRMLIAGIWLIPLIGAFIAKSHTPLASRKISLASSHLPEPPQEEAPQVLEAPGAAAPFNLHEHLGAVGGVPLLDWSSLRAWSDGIDSPEAAARAIDAGRRAWLLHLRDACLPDHRLHTTDDVFILSSVEQQVAGATAQYVATARRRIASVLGPLARFPVGERSILLVLDSEEDYYNYVSIYYPEEGEFALSGGMFIDAGCPHFVVVRNDLVAIEPVIAHELTHSALAYLRLPKWLDEGLAVNTERRVAGEVPGLYTPRELHGMHQQYWDAQRIQEFWSGESFDRTDDGNRLSYDLARIIVEQIGKQWDSFASFVATADREDGGKLAARTALSINLGAYAASLLEVDSADGWEPVEGSAPQQH